MQRLLVGPRVFNRGGVAVLAVEYNGHGVGGIAPNVRDGVIFTANIAELDMLESVSNRV